MKKFLFIFGSLFFGFVTSAQSGVTGNDLYKACQDNKDNAVLYIAGASGTINVFIASGRERNICFPEGVTAVQITDIACKYIEGNPEKRHFTAAGLVYISLLYAFPCQQNEEDK